MRAVAMRRARLGEVDDVVQDVLLRLWLAPRSFDPQRGTLRTFLSMQASGRAIDLVRGAKARRDRETASFERTEAVVAGPEEQVLARIDAGEARSRVARLPAPERAAIEQAFFAGSSYREAADALGEPEGTIKSRIRRSLRRMEAMGSSPTAAVV
jgi:RNA polymerase sigma-70 factor (ECF subfamily)